MIAWLGKAMNGLRRAPLLWFLELQRVVYSMGGQDTFENTLFRLQTPNGMLLVLGVRRRLTCRCRKSARR